MSITRGCLETRLLKKEGDYEIREGFIPYLNYTTINVYVCTEHEEIYHFKTEIRKRKYAWIPFVSHTSKEFNLRVADARKELLDQAKQALIGLTLMDTLLNNQKSGPTIINPDNWFDCFDNYKKQRTVPEDWENMLRDCWGVCCSLWFQALDSPTELRE